MKIGLNVFLLLTSLSVDHVYSNCHFIDGYWKVDYNRGLNKYDDDDPAEPPKVRQVGLGRLQVDWGHLVMDPQCVDRFILHVWDTKRNLMRYIYNSNETRATTVKIPMCTKMYVKVEIQEDDMEGQAPDSSFTSISEAAFTSQWVGEPLVNTNRTQVEIDKTFSHWSDFFTASYLKGVFLDWDGLVLNTECVRKTVIVVSRLVKGRLSDSVKTVRIEVPRDRTNFTLALQCEDLLPYSIQVKLNETVCFSRCRILRFRKIYLQIELIERVSLEGRRKTFAERSKVMEVLLICPWSEAMNSAEGAFKSCFSLPMTVWMSYYLFLLRSQS